MNERHPVEPGSVVHRLIIRQLDQWLTVAAVIFVTAWSLTMFLLWALATQTLSHAWQQLLAGLLLAIPILLLGGLLGFVSYLKRPGRLMVCPRQVDPDEVIDEANWEILGLDMVPESDEAKIHYYMRRMTRPKTAAKSAAGKPFGERMKDALGV